MKFSNLTKLQNNKLLKITMVLVTLLMITTFIIASLAQVLINDEPTYRLYEDSEYYNVEYAVFILPLDANSYVFMYDNTGFIGNENTNEVKVTTTVNGGDPFDMELVVPGSGWAGHGFTSTTTNPKQFGFQIISTGKVSFFLTLKNETDTFIQEVEAYQAETDAEKSNLASQSSTLNPITTTSADTEETKNDGNDSFIYSPWNFEFVLALTLIAKYKKNSFNRLDLIN